MTGIVATLRSAPLLLPAWTLLAVGLTVVASFLWETYVHVHGAEFAGRSLKIDFSVFWAAAELALSHGWAAPFDTHLLAETWAVPFDPNNVEMYWLYPPAFLAFLLPLGMLPFWWAWVTFGAVSLILFLVALRGPCQAWPGAAILIAFSPVSFFILATGQTPLLIAVLFIGAIEAIRRDQVVLAGLFLALMTVKPHLGLAVPFALAAGGHWRVIFWAALFTALMILVSLGHPGLAYWEAFFDGMVRNGMRMATNDMSFGMISFYGLLASFGMLAETALIYHMAAVLCVLGVLVWIWRKHMVPFDLKVAALCVAMLGISPYIIYYEWLFAVVGALYLARSSVGADLLRKALVGLIWVAPMIWFLFLPWPGCVLPQALLITMLMFCTVEAMRAR